MKKIITILLFFMVFSHTSVNADYTPTLDQDYKINLVTYKLAEYIRGGNQESRIAFLKQAIEKKTKITYEELEKIQFAQYNTLQEYTLWKLTQMLRSKGEVSFGGTMKPRILKNKYVRILVFEEDGLTYETRGNIIGRVGYYEGREYFSRGIEFFEVDKSTSTEDAIQSIMIGETNPDLCTIHKSEWSDDEFYLKSALNTSREDSEVRCNGFLDPYSMISIKRISDTLIMYAYLGQDPRPYDIYTMEVLMD